MDLPLFIPRSLVRKMIDAAYREGKREQFQEDSAAIDRVFKKDLADHERLLREDWLSVIPWVRS
jgi:hypothetical protein